MKRLLILTIAAGLAAACSQTEPRQAADAKKEPATPPPAAAPAPAATTGQPAAAGQQSPPSQAAATVPPQPVAPPAPEFREVTIPAGTSLHVTVLSNLASNSSKVEDPVRGALAKAVVLSGRIAVPAGAEITGLITDVKESGRVKGKASIGFRFNRVVVRGETYPIQTARVIREAEHKKGDDAKKGGIGAGLGAVVGGIAGGGKGAAIGAVAGGAGTVLATKGREVEVPAGTGVTVVVQKPLSVTVPIK